MSETIEVGLLAAGAAIAGGILSGIYQHFRDWFTRPKLVIEFHENGPANVVQASWDVGGRQVEWVIVRPGIRNRGRRPATNCRVFLISLSEVHSKVTATGFDDSMLLPWSGWDFSPKTLPPPEDIVSYLDIVRVRKDAPGWDFTFQRRLFSHDKLRAFQGTYRFRIVATADNAKPAFSDIDVDYKNDWHNLRAWKAS